MAVRYEDKLPELVETIVKLNKSFHEALRLVIRTKLGEDLSDCVRCGKPMLPRRTYAKLTEEQKLAIRGFILKGHTATHCSTCQASVNQLSEADLARLRGSVGA